MAYNWFNMKNLKRYAPSGRAVEDTYSNWMQHIKTIKNSVMSHDQMLAAVNSGQIQKLRSANPSGTVPDYDTAQIEIPRPKMQSQAPNGIHPLLRI
jgi:hypothetical protein